MRILDSLRGRVFVRTLDRSAAVSRAPTCGPGPDTHLEEDELEAALADHASVFRKYTDTSRSRNASVNLTSRLKALTLQC